MSYFYCPSCGKKISVDTDGSKYECECGVLLYVREQYHAGGFEIAMRYKS